MIETDLIIDTKIKNIRHVSEGVTHKPQEHFTSQDFNSWICEKWCDLDMIQFEYPVYVWERYNDKNVKFSMISGWVISKTALKYCGGKIIQGNGIDKELKLSNPAEKVDREKIEFVRHAVIDNFKFKKVKHGRSTVKSSR